MALGEWARGALNQMSISKLITTALVSTSLVTGGLATSAQADDWRNHGNGYDQNQSNYRAWNGGWNRNSGQRNWNNGPRDWNNGPRDWNNGPRQGHDHDFRPAPVPQVTQREHRDHRGRNIALGVGIVLLGAILAAEAGRHDHR